MPRRKPRIPAPVVSNLGPLTLLLALLLPSGTATGDATGMPLLKGSGLHLYTQQAYERFEPNVEAAVNERYDELVAAGMDTGRHLFDWRDLEPEQGRYDTRLVVEAMDALEARGIVNQFPNVVVLDSGGPVVPEYIASLLAGGVAWDDPRITGAFGELLEVFVPLMLERGMFMLGLSNEPGGYYEDFPAEAARFRGFVAAAVDRAHTLEPDLATTVVFAGPRDPAIPDLMPLTDVAAFNTYLYRSEPDPTCRLDGEPLPLLRSDVAENVAGYLDELVSVAQGRLVNIQEIGQASSGDSLGPATSEATQAAVYAALISALDDRRAHIRTVCNWTLNDHVDAWESLGQSVISEGLPACYAENVVDIFTATGLVRSNGSATPKPAFEVFRNGISRLAGFRLNQGISGTWFDPATPGQGFFIDIDPDHEFLFLNWSTFTSGGTAAAGEESQRWYTAQGNYAGASTPELAIWRSSGGRLDEPRPVTTTSVGTMSLEFDDCRRGIVRYAFDEGGASGAIAIQRALPAAARLCETLNGAGR